jgi:MFS transporter, ACS family, glucarate transporter
VRTSIDGAPEVSRTSLQTAHQQRGAEVPTPPRWLRVRYLLAFWLFVLSGVAFLDRTNIAIAGLQLSREYGLDNQRLGGIFSAFLLGYAIFQVPAGWLATRWGPRRSLTLGAIWWGVTTAFTAALPSTIAHAMGWLISIRFLLGVGEAVVYPAANQFVAQWIPFRERGLINGLIFAGVGAGSGLTPPLLNWLITHHGWRAAFWFSAALGIVVGIGWWFVARDLPEDHPSVADTELIEIRGTPARQVGPLQNASEPAAGASNRGRLSGKWLFQRRDLLALMVGYFSFGYIAWIFFSWFFVYLAQVRGLNLKTSAVFTMLPFLSMTIGCLAGGALSDWIAARWGLRAGRCGLAALALAATAALLVLGSQAHSTAAAGVILAAGAGALYLSQSSFWSVSVDLAGRSSGLFSSIVNMGGQIGGAVTASLTPWIAKRAGWPSSFNLAALLAVVAAMCWLFVHPEQPLRPETNGAHEM